MGGIYYIARQGGIRRLFIVKTEVGVLLWTSGQKFLRTLATTYRNCSKTRNKGIQGTRMGWTNTMCSVIKVRKPNTRNCMTEETSLHIYDTIHACLVFSTMRE